MTGMDEQGRTRTDTDEACRHLDNCRALIQVSSVAEIRIGTASWTDLGFIEDWYPPGSTVFSEQRTHAFV